LPSNPVISANSALGTSMSKAKPVTLAGEQFSKKEDVRFRVRNLIASYPLMSFVEGQDLKFCLSLFEHHPNYTNKIGSGILRVQIRLDDYGKRYFHLHRNDESDEDISWTKCLASIR
jgi:hypothetical protein